MKTNLLTLAAVVVLTACGSEGPAGPTGATGATGPSGPPGSYTKGDVYCQVTGDSPADSPTGNTTFSLTASCLTPADLPLTGSCANGALASFFPAGTWLAVDEPRNWNSATTPASWFCQWQTPTVDAASGLGGNRAEMCCIAQ